ncbi:sigma-70 family RNA polymerase sigma factor [Bacillus mycoides]|uniref:sigma-70 family RNA polymerase sigma factor n=1 Tax=Bacillus mycoides TaxID=1405 RepID=UPI0025A261C0|nr:sigma-70 family RNA polymerase sigma factor [Bacillus mycoides]MDM5429482.1 sigma-70 family RNA polymerase sigma factor [Bacillus mycoides]
MKLVSKVIREEKQEKRMKRIEGHRNREYILRLEEQWKEYNASGERDSFKYFCIPTDDGKWDSILLSIVTAQSRIYYNQVKVWSRLTYEDIFSYMSEAIWEAIPSHKESENYFFYDFLFTVMRSRIVDLKRTEGMTKGSPLGKDLNHRSLSYEGHFLTNNMETAAPRFEDEIETCKFLEDTLMGLELHAAKFYILDGITNISQIGRLLGVTDAKKAHRILDSAIKKLRENYTHV